VLRVYGHCETQNTVTLTGDDGDPAPCAGPYVNYTAYLDEQHAVEVTDARGTDMHIAHLGTSMYDEIYQVPLGEFAATRDQLAAGLKAAGDKTASAEVKRARKPSVPAWAANQVVWHAAEVWARLQAAVEALRQSHEKGGSAEEVRQGSRDQREAVRACESRAAEILARDGHAASPAVLEKVGRTLLALALGVPGAVPGRIEHEIQPPGFEALAGLSLPTPEPRAAPALGLDSSEARPAPADPPATLAADTDRRARDEEQARRKVALAAAEAERASTLRTLEEARARLAADEERLRAIEGDLAAARRSCDDSRRRLESAESAHEASKAATEGLLPADGD